MAECEVISVSVTTIAGAFEQQRPRILVSYQLGTAVLRGVVHHAHVVGEALASVQRGQAVAQKLPHIEADDDDGQVFHVGLVYYPFSRRFTAFIYGRCSSPRDCPFAVVVVSLYRLGRRRYTNKCNLYRPEHRDDGFRR